MSDDYKTRLKGEFNPNYKNVKRRCLHCNNEYINYNKKNKYCSQPCYFTHRKNETKEKNAAKKAHLRKLKLEKQIALKGYGSTKIYYNTCKNCKKLHIKKHSNKILFCKICLPIIIKLNGKRYSEMFSNKIKCNCAVCGKEHMCYPSNIKKFCSNKCYFSTYKDGGNPNYKGGITTEGQKIRKSDSYKQWRYDVFVRDNYTCKHCGQVGGKLHVDHIYPFSLYPEKRLDVNNGRVLCYSCHKKTPTYLRRFKSKEDFEKTLANQ